MEVELEMLKGSVMALVVAANTSAEGDTYRELSDALLRVRRLLHCAVLCWHTPSFDAAQRED